MTAQTLYLASRSPRRVALLQQIGITCKILPVNIDEAPLENEQPENYVIRLAKQKAETCYKQLTLLQQKTPVLAADTTVVLENTILGKPNNEEHARQMLRALSGNVHYVHTAVALAIADSTTVALSTTRVEMMMLTMAQIDAYIATNDHADKAGSYGIQGFAGAWIKHIEGSYSGVMGLPLYETAELLRTLGIKI